jgi:predicted nucleotidyltransferase
MEIGINNHLRRISSELLIKNTSLEGINIERSVESIKRNLKLHFGNEITDVIVFGSYSRGTILPRKYDPNSDIDILILFNCRAEKLKPQSYREKLKRFAEKHYSSARVVKDHPSIVVELNHINFDLVPAIFDDGVFYDSIEIPGKDSDWIETEPNKFNKELSDSNSKFNSVVKPLIRILKYWNSANGYPYISSFEFESMIASMNFAGNNFATGFYYAADELETWGRSELIKRKVRTLQTNISLIKRFLEQENLEKAKKVVSRILPGF